MCSLIFAMFCIGVHKSAKPAGCLAAGKRKIPTSHRLVSFKDIEDAKESLNEVNDSLTVFQEDVEETQKWIQKKIKSHLAQPKTNYKIQHQSLYSA